MSSQSDTKKESKPTTSTPPDKTILNVLSDTPPSEAIVALESGLYSRITFAEDVTEKNIIAIVSHLPRDCLLWLEDIDRLTMRRIVSAMPGPCRAVSININNSEKIDAFENHIADNNFVFLPKLFGPEKMLRRANGKWYNIQPLQREQPDLTKDKKASTAAPLKPKSQPTQESKVIPVAASDSEDAKMKACLASLNKHKLDQRLIDRLGKFKDVAQTLKKQDKKEYKAAIEDLRWLGGTFLDLESPDKIDEINALSASQQIDTCFSLKQKLLSIADKKFLKNSSKLTPEYTHFFKKHGNPQVRNQSALQGEETAHSDDSTETLGYS